MSPASDHLEKHKDCGHEIYWDLVDNTKPYDPVTNKKVPHWPNGKRHFCYPCGAAGFYTSGCGAQLVQVEKEVAPGVFKKIMVAAKGLGIREHRCEYVRRLTGLSTHSSWHPKEFEEPAEEKKQQLAPVQEQLPYTLNGHPPAAPIQPLFSDEEVKMLRVILRLVRLLVDSLTKKNG